MRKQWPHRQRHDCRTANLQPDTANACKGMTRWRSVSIGFLISLAVLHTHG
jgi:hypothetical protein